MDNVIFADKAEIIYVNATVQEDNPLGRLMHDFLCDNPDDMHHKVLSERARFFKEDRKGRSKMCKIMEEVLEQGRAEGIDENKTSIALNMLRDNVPIEKVSQYASLPIERITEIGRLHNLL